MISFPPDVVLSTRLAEDHGTAEWPPSKKDLQPITDEVCSQSIQITLKDSYATSSPSFPSHLLAAIDHRITSLEHKLFQTRSSPVNSEPLTYSMLTNNPLHLTAKRKTSLSEDSLHLSQDVSHDTFNVFSDSDGECGSVRLLGYVCLTSLPPLFR